MCMAGPPLIQLLLSRLMIMCCNRDWTHTSCCWGCSYTRLWGRADTLWPHLGVGLLPNRCGVVQGCGVHVHTPCW